VTHDHSHAHLSPATLRNERALWTALAPTTAFMLAEIIGGVVFGSLALISDAGHMATDVFGIALAIAAIRLGRRPPDARRTFGYERLEILAAAANALLLIGVAVYILYEAWRRLSEPPEIQSIGMLVIAVMGLGVNLFSMRVLAGGKDESLNLKGAYLEVWSDLLGSIGVIVAAVLIRLTGWTVIDTIVAVLIGLWVVPRTAVLLRGAVNILLEGVPDGIDLVAVRDAIAAEPGIEDVHDLHVWALTGGRICLTAHVLAPTRRDDQDALIAATREMLHERFGIGHVTLQVEREPCPDAAAGGHRFL
jgi:cobalt-zinc-cadmium efflux system protein